MRYIDEFRNKRLIQKVSRTIKAISPTGTITIMEVCGTHTQNFLKFGLKDLLPPQVRLIAGPGCPVCVSAQDFIDRAILYAKRQDAVVVTFGDMLRVPGSASTLEEERAKGMRVSVVYSPLESLAIARKNPGKKIIFLSVGFETTAPAIALSIIAAKKEKLKNIFFFTALKRIPPAMEYLLKDERVAISGFLCPGHVSSIIGIKPYAFIPKKYAIGCCIAGFEPLDILEGICMLLAQIEKNKPLVANQYMRVVKKDGNRKAQALIAEVFGLSDASWRGFGRIPQSGFSIRARYADLDAERRFPLAPKRKKEERATLCRCADILKGLISPRQCPLFSRDCSPQHPQGPCMISSEGACNAYYRYRETY